MARETLREENARLQARIAGLEADLQGMREFHTRCAKQCDELSEKNSKLSERLKDAVSTIAYNEAQLRAVNAGTDAHIASLSESINQLMSGTFYSQE